MSILDKTSVIDQQRLTICGGLDEMGMDRQQTLYKDKSAWKCLGWLFNAKRSCYLDKIWERMMYRFFMEQCTQLNIESVSNENNIY